MRVGEKYNIQRQALWDSQPLELSSIRELSETLRTHFPGPASLYAAFDDQVYLGVYRDLGITLGDPFTGGPRLLVERELEYLQELRVFDETCEVRLIRRAAGCWRGRALKDLELQDVNSNRGSFDEIHKLWGKVSTKNVDPDWTLLADSRGSRLLAPLRCIRESGKIEDGVGMLVRRYLEFGKASEGNAPLQCVDERCCGLVPFGKGETYGE